MKETDYREAYEREHLKCAELAGRIADLEAKSEELEWKLNRIKNNPLWKLSRPARSGMHWVIRQRDRLSNCGGPRGVLHKISYKKREREAMKQFGTASFPTEEQAALERAAVFPRMVKISILVPLWNNDREFQAQMLDSVMNQTYSNWELCLADGSDEAHGYMGEICREYAERSGGRIRYRHLDKNDGIAGNTNACLQMSTGEYIGLLDQDDILHPSVLYEYVKAINEQGADYLYCDETTFKSGNIDHMLTMHFKPDYAPDNLRANNYICHFSVFARTLLDGDELFRKKFDGSQDHDMILRLTENAEKIVHVPRLMYYWRSHAGSTASNIEAKPYAIEAAKGAVSEHLRKAGYEHFRIESTRAFETIFRIRYQIIGTPKISIIIPNRNHAEDLRRCVTSILEKSTYDNYEIIIVENNSDSGEIRVGGKVMGKELDMLTDAGIIIEEPGFLRKWSAYHNLEFLYTIRNRKDKAYLCSILEKVGLEPGLRRPVGKYSLGMKQRLAIAQAIMEDPRILILDEPMNGLDRKGVGEMRELFLEMKAQGKVILLASHNREDISLLCDEVYEMENGDGWGSTLTKKRQEGIVKTYIRTHSAF